MKSNTKHQMNSKQMPFIFKILLSVSRITGLCMGADVLLVPFWAAPGRMISGMIALSWRSHPMAKAASKASPEDAQFFTSGMNVLFCERSPETLPECLLPEKRGHWLEKEWNFMRRTMGDEWQGTHCTHGTCWVKSVLHPPPASLCRRAATRDSLLLAPLLTCLLSKHWARGWDGGQGWLLPSLVSILLRVHFNHWVASPARWVTYCSSWGSSLSVGDSSFWFEFQLQLEPWRQGLPIGTWIFAFPHSTSTCCPVHACSVLSNSLQPRGL